MARNEHKTERSATPRESGWARGARSFARLLLVVTLVFGLTIPNREANAFAPAIPAGAAVAALAAEMGITTTELALAFGTIVAAGTGIYLACDVGTDANPGLWGGDVTNNGFEWNWNSKWQDGSQNLPGFDAWGDLDAGAQAEYGNPRAYTQSQWAAWLLENGLLQDNGNGGLEPSEPPDPDEDPNGNKAWNKLRNTVTALASDGVVAVGESADMVMMMLAFGAAGMFGANTGVIGSGLGLSYQRQTQIAGQQIVFVTYSGTTVGSTGYGEYTYPVDRWTAIVDDAKNSNYKLYDNGQYPDVTFSSNSGGLKSNQITNNYIATIDGNSFKRTGGGNVIYYIGVEGRNQAILNINYGGRYVFPDGTIINNGVSNNPLELSEPYYGQMENTPEGLYNNINNNNNYNNYFDNVNNELPEGDQYVMQIPENYGKPDYQPDYSDFVKVKGDEEVTSIPDNSLIQPGDVVVPNPGVDPNPDPELPEPETDVEESFREKAQRILSQPLEQAFPFCLMADLRRFTVMVDDAVALDVNRENVVLPTTEFEIPGMDEIRFEGRPVKEFGNMVRPYISLLIVAVTIIATFAYFLKRGGE